MRSTEYCCACQSNKIETIETIPTTKIAEVWSKTDLEAGEAIIHYVNQGKMPDTVYINKCHVCGLEFANPTFAADAEWYEKIEKYGMRWEFSQCLKDLGDRPKTILEIGCGEGYFLELAASKGHNIVGIDFNEEAIKVASKKGLEAYIGDLKEMRKYTNKQFDAVAFFHVIEHLEYPENFLSELAEMMPIGSSLHFSCPGLKRFTTEFDPENRVKLRDMWDYPPHHQTRWNQKAANEILSRFGWKLISYGEEPFSWLGISTFLVSKNLLTKGLNLSDISPIALKIKVIQKMGQIFIPVMFRQLKGMSMYCMAVRE